MLIFFELIYASYLRAVLRYQRIQISYQSVLHLHFGGIPNNQKGHNEEI